MNANPIGWTALSLKLFILFISASWIALNSINNKAEDYPLVKIQYALILFLFPLVLTESWVQLRFFLGLKPDVITSCCGALFTPAGGTLASSLSGLPIRPMMILFFSSFFLLTATGIFAIFHNVKLLLYSFSGMAFFFLFVSIASIISFISLYFYRIPTHHCPFDIFQGQYFYIGYPLYASLLGGVFFGMFAGFAEPLGKIRSLNAIIEKMKAKWIKISLILIFIFMLISAWPIIFSTFTLEGYY